MHIFFSAGEPSGDQHAAQIMDQLRQRDPSIRFSGFGGPAMSQAGQSALYPLTNLAVMGLGGILPLLGQFWRLYKQAEAFMAAERPDAVVLVDFPGFNWWVARAARKAGVPVFFYCPPQLWAWGGWRLRKLKRLVDCVLSVLPFEAKWYRDRGVDVEYVGHPFFDEVAAHELQSRVMDQLRKAPSPRVAILPGSRKQEVNRNFPVMLDIISDLHESHPEARFQVACYKQWHYDRCGELIRERGKALPIDLYLESTPEVIEASDCCLMVSGSVSLELLARRKPTVVMYRGSPLLYVLAKILVHCPFMTLPNLIAGRAVMPEFPFSRRSGTAPKKIKAILSEWLSNPESRIRSQQEVAALADTIVEAGGVRNAAETLLRRLGVTQAESRRVQDAA
ncbi:lipid-A-disaccharide synthase [Planctomicrobium sp. SH661]|uniref:lipid-A-disaccharide synthase n=1 Tax=Planctomicrobium sp. SH661 TaxID=3448124 RepID=UPI003F5B3598